MPGGEHDAVACDHQHRVQSLRASQRIDRLLRRLCDGTCDIERRVDRHLHANATTERFQIGMDEGIVGLPTTWIRPVPSAWITAGIFSFACGLARAVSTCSCRR